MYSEFARRWGVLIPSAGVAVEIEFQRMAPRDITFHYSRMFTGPTVMNNDSEFEELNARIRSGLDGAIESLVTAEPDHIILGFGAPSFMGGVEGERALMSWIQDQAGGVPVTLPPDSYRKALETLGAKRIAVLSPYQKAGAEHVAHYFRDAGFELVRQHNMAFTEGKDIARVTEQQLVNRFLALDGDDVDAIIQVGANLIAARTADAVERVLGKPVLSLNAVTLWNALRSTGDTQSVPGAGRLLREL